EDSIPSLSIFSFYNPVDVLSDIDWGRGDLKSESSFAFLFFEVHRILAIFVTRWNRVKGKVEE
ncbi:hypothetical protein PanWU01x14_224550, partial [Parasponia andersonii]